MATGLAQLNSSLRRHAAGLDVRKKSVPADAGAIALFGLAMA